MISMTASIPDPDPKKVPLEVKVMKKMNMTSFSYNKIESAPKYDIEEELPQESDDQLTERLE